MIEAARICERWAGRRVGDAVPCRSPLIGRTVTVRVHGAAEPVEVIGCAVPSTDKPSKRCRPAYLVKRGGLFPRVDAVDGGRVRNASRTPRATHGPGHTWEIVSGRYYFGPREVIGQNRDEGVPLMSGLDLPYVHRVGSSVCCPDSALNALRLVGLVRDEYETEGAMSATTRRQLLGLAKHLRSKHPGVDLPSTLGAEDWAGADAITTAGDVHCAQLLNDWQTSQDEHTAIRRVEVRKKRAAAKSKRRARAKSIATEGGRAQKALLRKLRAKSAGGLAEWAVIDREGDSLALDGSGLWPSREAAQAAVARSGRRGLEVRRV